LHPGIIKSMSESRAVCIYAFLYEEKFDYCILELLRACRNPGQSAFMHACTKKGLIIVSRNYYEHVGIPGSL